MTKYLATLEGNKLVLIVDHGMVFAVIHNKKQINLPRSQWQSLNDYNFSRIKQLA